MPQTTNKKHILFIVSQPYYQWRGSPIRVGFDVQALAELGHQVDLLVLPFGENRSLPGVTVHRVKNWLGIKDIPIGPSIPKLFFDVVLYFRARQMIRHTTYDVLHGVEDAGAVCALLRSHAHANVVFEKHSDPASYRKKGLRNIVMAAYASVERWIIRRADAVIGTGPGLAAQVREVAPEKKVYHIPDIPSSLAESTPQGINKARAKMTRNDSDVIITYVGSFAVYQGIDLLFAAIPEACRQCPQARFVVIGGSPVEIDARKDVLKQAGIGDAVLFAGKCPPAELPDWLAASDILLSPRIAGTNTPLKLLDYLKAGKAIVATENAANRQILDETCAQFAVPDPAQFAAAIIQLARDEPLRKKLAAAGQERMQNQYNYRVFRDGLNAVYTALTP
ncbi:MAG: glycosyltransferase [Kiritimatiellia bacterium]